MKRAINILGALAVAGSLGLTATMANAALPTPGSPFGGVTCTNYATGSVYPAPDRFIVCANVPIQTKSGRFGVLSSEPSFVRNRLNAFPVYNYVFWNRSDYQVYFPANGSADVSPSDQFGWSLTGLPDPYTVVYLESPAGYEYPLDIVDEVLAHETGHHLSVSWGNSLYGGTLPSATSRFISLVTHDKFMLNNKWKAGNKYAKRKSCGSGGALVNLFDPDRGHEVINGVDHYGQYVCDGNNLRTTNIGGIGLNGQPATDPGYVTEYKSSNDPVTGTNYAVLKYVYKSRIDNLEELFAGAYAVAAGEKAQFHWAVTDGDARGYGSPTRMIDAEFDCALAMVESLRIRDKEPGNPPGTGYTNNCTRSLAAGTIEEVPDDE